MGSAVEFLGIAAFIAIVVYIGSRLGNPWLDDLEIEFQAALGNLGLEGCDFIVDRVVTPSGDRIADVYRIFRDVNGHYFLFMKTGESPGVLKPLTKERALLAARLSGYDQRIPDPDVSDTHLAEVRGDSSKKQNWIEDPDLNTPGSPTQSVVPTASTSAFHGLAVKLCLYLVVWPNIILASAFTLVAVFAPPMLILMVIAWWGLGSLLSLRQCFAGTCQTPRKAVWIGLAVASALISLIVGYGWLKTGETLPLLWIPALCIPVAGYWSWLVRKGFRF